MKASYKVPQTEVMKVMSTIICVSGGGASPAPSNVLHFEHDAPAPELRGE